VRKIFSIILTIVLLKAAHAQQKPHYTQYILNQYIVNPAITGIENYVDVKLSHRHQWVGLQDAPVTTYFTMHSAIGKKDYNVSATSYRVPGENPRGKATGRITPRRVRIME
jgi:type IX secretion system PorP/SprF family membrane protein